MYQGVDTAARITPAQAAALRREGVSFVGRYLGSPTLGKTLTAAEASGLRAAGLAVLLYYEIAGTEARTGAACGTAHGKDARRWAQELGAPDGTAIYFAVDFAPAAGDMAQIEAYLRAAAAQLGPYRCGVYGCYAVVEEMARRGACGAYCQCVAWSGGHISQFNDVYQYQWQNGAEAKALAAKTGFPVDLCRCEDMRKAGMWMASYAQYEDGDGVIYVPETPKPQKEPWYAGAMAWAEEAGLIRDGRPRDGLTRAEMATVMMRYNAIVEEKFAKIAEALLLKQPEDDKIVSGLISDD